MIGAGTLACNSSNLDGSRGLRHSFGLRLCRQECLHYLSPVLFDHLDELGQVGVRLLVTDAADL